MAVGTFSTRVIGKIVIETKANGAADITKGSDGRYYGMMSLLNVKINGQKKEYSFQVGGDSKQECLERMQTLRDEATRLKISHKQGEEVPTVWLEMPAEEEEDDVFPTEAKERVKVEIED
jgi:hypothetical protein